MADRKPRKPRDPKTEAMKAAVALAAFRQRAILAHAGDAADLLELRDGDR